MLDVMKSVPAVLKAWLVVILLAMLVVSCSSSTPPATGGGSPPATVYAGATECFLCHYPDDSINRFTGMDIVEKWLKRRFSNR